MSPLALLSGQGRPHFVGPTTPRWGAAARKSRPLLPGYSFCATPRRHHARPLAVRPLAHLACPHLTTLSLRVVRGELERPHLDSPHRDLIFRKGNEHEAAYLARLRDRGPIDRPDPYVRRRELRPCRGATADGGGDQGRRAPTSSTSRISPTRTGDGAGLPTSSSGCRTGPTSRSTRSSRGAPKPAHLLQLAFYAEQVARIQGAPIEHVHVENGRGERETFRVAELEAYYRRVRGRFLRRSRAEPQTYGWPATTAGSATSGRCAGNSAWTTTT